ncbi:Chitin synthase class 2 [Biomphalaria glabrata]|nr:chitin synthase chs-2-like [Biomphalaria glabrata]
MEEHFGRYSKENQFLTPPARFEGARKYAPSYLSSSASDNNFGIIISTSQSRESLSPPPRIYGPSSGRSPERIPSNTGIEFYTGYAIRGHARRSSYETVVYNPTSYNTLHGEHNGSSLSNKSTHARLNANVPLAKYGSVPLLDNLHNLTETSSRRLRRHSLSSNQQESDDPFLNKEPTGSDIQLKDVDLVHPKSKFGHQKEHISHQTESLSRQYRDGNLHNKLNATSTNDSGHMTHRNEDVSTQATVTPSANMSKTDVRDKLNNIFSRQLGLHSSNKIPASHESPSTRTTDANHSLPQNPHGQKVENDFTTVRRRKPPVPLPHQAVTGDTGQEQRPTVPLPPPEYNSQEHKHSVPSSLGYNVEGHQPPMPVLSGYNGEDHQTSLSSPPEYNIQGHHPVVQLPPGYNGQGHRPPVPISHQHLTGHNGQEHQPTVRVPQNDFSGFNGQVYNVQAPIPNQGLNVYNTNLANSNNALTGGNVHPITTPTSQFPAGPNFETHTFQAPVPGYGFFYAPAFHGQMPTTQLVTSAVPFSNPVLQNIPVISFQPPQQVNNNVQDLNDVSKSVPEVKNNIEDKKTNMDDETLDDPDPDYQDSESGISYDLSINMSKKNQDDAISMAKTNDDNMYIEEEDMTWRPYDVFTVSERDTDDDNKVFKEILKAIRGSLYLIIVTIMLVGTVSSRVSLYLLASDINQAQTRGKAVVLIMFCMCGPMVYNWLNAFMKIMFGGKQWPSIKTFAVMLFFELVTTFGMCLLVFKILPSVDFFRGITITMAMFQIPAICQVMMLDKKLNVNFKPILKIVMSIIAMLLQIGAIIYIMIMNFVTSRKTITVLKNNSKEDKILDPLFHESVWELPVALILISFGWWENYVSSDWSLLGRVHIGFKHWRHILQETRETSYFLIGPFKIALVVILGKYLAGADFALPTWTKDTKMSPSEFHEMSYSLLYITLGAAILCTYLSGLACKLHMQKTAFALPLVLSPPASLVLVYLQCRYEFLPRHWHSGAWFCPDTSIENLIEPIAVSGTLWLSYCIIVSHIWFPKSERMAKIEKLFLTPHFNAIFPDFNLTLRRRRNDQELRATRFEHFTYVGDDAGDHLTPEGVAMEDTSVTPTIFVCATLWHETTREMTQLLKSLFRLDYSHCASQLAQAKFNIRDPDYFHMEIHIIFDDAFDIDLENNKFVPNTFVTQFISCMEDAARSVVKGFIIIPSPVKVVTPYGGRLIWTMPGQTQMIIHLKDKNKIRHRKRWSQVMYLYYLLGFRLLGSSANIDVEKEEKEEKAPKTHQPSVRNRKKKVNKIKKSNMPLKQLLMKVPPEHYEQLVETSENTFILTLDGDVDFRPDSVKLLIDRMKKNKKVGAVCGRIHPIGSGPMVWYQQFEYAIGHWLQKAAEHVFGCVLCCPGCFSLFRGSAVMDDNVLKMYTTKPTEARHFIQFEQGEDRWLCTLLLQQGHRIDYSAGADALTYAPETFNEFFNQRRRWSPSTLANMMDLLASWRETVRLNDNISRIYVLYQFVLMASSILAPSTVVLMITSSYHAVIGLSNMWAYILSILPVAIYTAVCLTTKTNTQIKVGAVLTAIYTVVMMIATVGTIISIATENFSSPNVVFITGLGVIFISAAVLHPQEIYCLVYGALYFLVVPSTFILLTIFYLCNLNNVSWGTREVPKKMTPEEEEALKKAEEERKKKKKSWNIFTMIGLMNIVNELREVIRNIWGLRNDLQQGQGQVEQTQPPKPAAPQKVINVEQPKPTKSKKEVTGYEPDPDNPFWIHLEEIGNGPVEMLDNSEEDFWKFLIKKYLYPIEENKEQKEKIAADLLEVRNNIVFIYIMLNFLWTVIALQLQNSEDALKDYYIVKKYEPMSLLFLVIFASVMVVQFVGMVMHRWGTFLHLMSSTRIDWFSGAHSEDDFARFVVQEIQKHQNLEPTPDYGEDEDEDELSSLPTDVESAPDYDIDDDVVSTRESVRSSYNNQMVWPRDWNHRPSHPGHFPRLENILDHKLGRLQQQLSHAGRSVKGNNNLQFNRPNHRGFNGWSHRDATMRQKFFQQNFQLPQVGNQDRLNQVRVI